MSHEKESIYFGIYESLIGVNEKFYLVEKKSAIKRFQIGSISIFLKSICIFLNDIDSILHNSVCIVRKKEQV